MKNNLLFKKAASLLFWSFALVFMLVLGRGYAQTNPTAQNLPYTQNFGTTTFTSMPAGMAAWTAGGNRTTQSAAESATPAANAVITAATATDTQGGIYGYATASNARTYIQQSSNTTNGTNTIAVAINTGTATAVSFSYQLELLNGGVTTQDYGHAIQYRLGTTGSFTTVSGSAMTFGAVTSYTTSTRSFIISGLTASSVYQFRWIVWRPSGSGGSKGIGIDNISIAAVTAPLAPTISAITPGNGQLSVAFTAGGNGGSAITNYKYSTDGGSTFILAGTTTSPIVITGLTNGTSYNVQIRGVNAIGDGTATASTAATPRTIPSAPFITAITPGNGQLSVAFTAGATGGSAITDYKYSTNGGSSFTSAGTTASPIVISGLTNGTTYDVQLLGVNAAGDGTPSTTVQGTPVVTPIITANKTSVAALSTTYGTASTTDDFTVSGVDLSGDITITAPNGFEVSSTSSTSGFATTQILTQSSGVVATTTIYVRLSETALAGTYSGNISLTSNGANTVNVSTTASVVSTKQLTITGLTADDKVYDATTTATLSGTPALMGVIAADVANVTLGGTVIADFSQSNIGTALPVTVAGYAISGSAAANYTLTQPTGLSANITSKALTISGLTADNKPFDGTTTATLSGTPLLVGVANADLPNVILGGTYVANFSQSAAGTDLPVTVSGYTISGSAAGNYSLSQPTGLTANIITCTPTTGTTTITVCDTYTWTAGNGNTYTESGTYTYATDCHTETLNLTINYSTSNTTTVSTCDTYTWAAPLGNGQTYTTSQSGITFISTNAAGCPHTETLNLTINYSTSNTTTATACDSYTWAGPLGSGQTYTTSQSGISFVSTNAAGCPHTETLNLTINYSTSNTTTATACDSYTWAAPLGNGQTYTTSQSGVTFVSTNAVGCLHTETLNLTINYSTSNTTTATACDSYTWTAPLGNGQTYTLSQSGITFVSTNAAGCLHTETLNLTINNSTSNTTTVSACDSYTWTAGNGNTYTTSGNYTYVTGCNTEILALTINTNTIITQPSNVQVCKSTGSTAVFAVVAGASNASYQWYYQPASENPLTGLWSPIFDNANYSGATSAALTVTKTEPYLPETGTKYRVVITSDCGTITSNNATLTDILLPPTPGTLVLTNENAVAPATATTPVTAVAIYVGTDTEFKLTAAPVSNVQYKWTLPVGMTTTSAAITTENFIYVKFSASSSSTPLIPYVQTINTQGCLSDPKATLPLTRLLPTAPVLNMNNGITTAPITTFAPYMGTETVFRLSVTSAVSTTSYVWELPEGVNRLTALNGGSVTTDTTSIEPFIFINFAGVTNLNTYSYTSNDLLTHVLRIGVKSKNGVGVSITTNNTVTNPATTSTAKLLTLTAVAPYSPATLTLNDGLSTTAITLISKLIGQQGTYRLSAAASPLASSYAWEIPAGVTRVTSLDGATTTISTTSDVPFIFVKFTDNVSTSFIQFGVKAVNGIGSSVNNNSGLLPATTSTAKVLRLTTAVPAAPVTLAINNGITTTPVTIISKLVGQEGTYRLSATASALANSYEWELPTGITRVTALDGATTTTSTSSTDPFIFIKFTDNVSASFMQFGVKAVNGVGASITNNSALNPATTSTAKLLRLNTTVPLAPVTITLTELASTTAITVVSKYIAKPTVLKLAAAPSALANSYLWELPSGVKRTDVNGLDLAGLTSVDSFIYISFSEFVVNDPATITLALGVKAVNGIGASVTVNPAPYDSSTAKLLRVTAGLPSVVAAINGAASVCDRAEGYDYLFSSAIGANSYVITAPSGAIVTSASNPSNTTNTLTTSDVNFNVVYGTAAFSPTDRSLTIRSGNAFGFTANAKILLLTKITCPNPTKMALPAVEFKAVAYPNPYVSSFQLDFATSSQNAVEMNVYDMMGKLVETQQLNLSTSNQFEIGGEYPAGVYNVILKQGENTKVIRVIKR